MTDTGEPLDGAEISTAAKIAALALSGVSSQSAIAKQLGISPARVSKVVRTEAYKELIQKSVDKSLVSALDDTRTQMAKLSREAVRVIAERLKDNDLDAAKMVLKGIGLDGQDGKQQDAAINIIMPGAEAPVTVETKRSDNGTT